MSKVEASKVAVLIILFGLVLQVWKGRNPFSAPNGPEQLVEGVSAAGMPPSSPQGGVYGVSRNEFPGSHRTQARKAGYTRLEMPVFEILQMIRHMRLRYRHAPIMNFYGNPT
jgi:hypothetical protein